MKPLRILPAAVLAAICAVPLPVAGQQSITGASVSGRVLDPSGGSIPGATVTARSIDRNQQQDVVAGAAGEYRFLLLPVGSYELTASAPGFAARTVPVTLRLGEAAVVSIALPLDTVTAQVDVPVAVADTRRTQESAIITPADIDALPLNGRNYLDLALLVPGVSRTVQRNTERFAETSAVPGAGLSVAGQRNLNNTFIVDGVSANDDAAGLAGTYFAEEVIRELQVVTSGGIAEFGRASAGIVNIATRAGANDRHGRAYGYFRHDAFDARNPLASRKDPLRQFQYGLTASGPVRRNRTFWFANTERTDFNRTGIVTIAPANVEAITRVLDATGYRGPRISTGEFPTGYETTNLFGRIDDSFRPGNRLAVRFSLYDVTSENARGVGGLNAATRGTSLANRDQTIAANWSVVRGAESLNELRAQVTRSRLAAPPNDPDGPAVNIAGVANFGTPSASPTGRDLDVVEVSNSYTMVRAPHLLKAGATLLHERLDIAFPGALQGLYTFSSLASFQAGRYVNFQQAFGESRQLQSNPNIGFFVQDEWRPHAAVTLNMGLRYDLQWLDAPVGTDTSNVSPRIGVAVAPGDGRTIVRASGGLYYDRIPLRAVSNALQRDGVSYRMALLSFGQPDAPVFPAALPGFPDGVLTNVTSIDSDIENGVGRQAGMQIERQLARSMSVSAGYRHLTGRRIVMARNINVPTLTAAEAAALGVPNLGRPDPRVGNNSQYQSIGRSRYDALTLALNAPRAPWGTLRVAYTLSKALDDAGNAFFSSPQDNANVRDDWGRSDNDQRHRLVVRGAAPVGAGFQAAWLFAYASAPPFNIQTGTDRNNDTNPNDRPAGIGRNTAQGFDAATLDLRVSRRLAFGGMGVDVLVDAFNVLNRSNFLIPNNTFGPGPTPPAAFGQPTAAADPRQVQVGVRWNF